MSYVDLFGAGHIHPRRRGLFTGSGPVRATFSLPAVLSGGLDSTLDQARRTGTGWMSVIRTPKFSAMTTTSPRA